MENAVYPSLTKTRCLACVALEGLRVAEGVGVQRKGPVPTVHVSGVDVDGHMVIHSERGPTRACQLGSR